MPKLQQDQVWKTKTGFIRIIHLERLSVAYKVLQDMGTRDGTHHEVSKKEFTRLIKSAALLTPEEVRAARG
ncbi:MAG: hypothetical protein WCO94_12050 [Verrucomicrobiota bacterium]